MKKMSYIALLVITFTFAIYTIGPDSIVCRTWHLFNNSQVLYKGMNISLPNDWWVFSKGPESLYLAKVPKTTKLLRTGLSFSKKHYEFTPQKIDKMSAEFCSGRVASLKTFKIDDELTFEVECSPLNATQIEMLWLIPSKQIAILTDGLGEKEFYYSIVKSINWNK